LFGLCTVEIAGSGVEATVNALVALGHMSFEVYGRLSHDVSFACCKSFRPIIASCFETISMCPSLMHVRHKPVVLT
jgi:hypothetical protein